MARMMRKAAGWGFVAAGVWLIWALAGGAFSSGLFWTGMFLSIPGLGLIAMAPVVGGEVRPG